MSELTEASLEAMITEIHKRLEETSERVTATPKRLIVRPSDLEALGLTVNDVVKIIKENT